MRRFMTNGVFAAVSMLAAFTLLVLTVFIVSLPAEADEVFTGDKRLAHAKRCFASRLRSGQVSEPLPRVRT
jgi:hypothetical protein